MSIDILRRIAPEFLRARRTPAAGGIRILPIEKRSPRRNHPAMTKASARLLRAAHQAARPLAGELVVAQRLDAGHEGVPVALGALDQAAAAGRQVVDHLGTLEA